MIINSLKGLANNLQVKNEQTDVSQCGIELEKIRAAILQNSAVKEAMVSVKENKKILAYVVPKNKIPLKNTLLCERVSFWNEVFQHLYGEAIQTSEKIEFNIKGWNSSYTDKPLPEEEMKEWLHDTIENIKALKPRRVLEIGCGTGLILVNIAPHCEEYWATDLSSGALDCIEILKKKFSQLNHVKLFHRAADDFKDFEHQQFDLVIINSVVQYFPSIDYFINVLKGSASVIDKKGYIFAGDLRNFALLNEFHSSVEAFKSSDDTTKFDLHAQIAKALRKEREFTIDPLFFTNINSFLPNITYSQIKLKNSQYHNELTGFRYNVICYVGHDVSKIKEAPWVDWSKTYKTISALKEHLSGTKPQPEIIAIKSIPNARLSGEVSLMHWLGEENSPYETLGNWRRRKKDHIADFCEPSDLEKLAATYGYNILICPSLDKPCAFDVIFMMKKITDTQFHCFRSDMARLTKIEATAEQYANIPLQDNGDYQLTNAIYDTLKQTLPNHMIPSDFIIVDSLPTTSNIVGLTTEK